MCCYHKMAHRLLELKVFCKLIEKQRILVIMCLWYKYLPVTQKTVSADQQDTVEVSVVKPDSTLMPLLLPRALQRRQDL